MPTPTPKVSYCFVCEDVRIEQGNKLTILGFYGIIPAAAPPLHIVLPAWPLPIKLLFMVGMSNGKASAVARIISPDESLLVESPTIDIDGDPEAEGLHHGFGFAPLMFTQQGQHFLQILFDNKEVFKQAFKVTHGLIPKFKSSLPDLAP